MHRNNYNKKHTKKNRLLQKTLMEIFDLIKISSLHLLLTKQETKIRSKCRQLILNRLEGLPTFLPVASTVLKNSKVVLLF